jgi:Flp pilus assembly protein CpaB
MSNAKSSRIITIGIAVFVIGGALLFLVLRHNGSSPSQKASSTAPTTTTTLPGAVNVAATPVPTSFQFTIPTGDSAVAVSMSYFPAIGGYVKAGDVVNAYSVIKTGCTPSAGAVVGAAGQGVHLLLSNVKVLEVIGSPPASAGQPASFLLALTPAQAEEIIYAESFESLYFTLTTGTAPSAANVPALCVNAL